MGINIIKIVFLYARLKLIFLNNFESILIIAISQFWKEKY